MRRSYLPGSVCLVALLLLLPSLGAAQITTGEIFGKVTDQTGAVLPGVTVTIESPALLQPQTAVTTGSGAFSFPQLPIGTYKVTYDLSGFKKLVREGVVISVGFSAELNAKLEVSSVQETVTVSGESPIVDTKAVTTGTNFDRQALDQIPSARDPWVVLNMVPGVVMSNVNVGGNLSGQQPGFSMRGAGDGNTMWNIDGATTTDMAATGASSQYYDFEAFEEIQFTTGGADASVQTSGININMVTRSGSNVFKGSVRGTYTDDNFQGNNVSRDLYYGGGSTTTPLAGAPIKEFWEAGFEVGGPIVKNRLWWWGSAARQNINNSVVGFFRTTPECTPVPNTYEQLDATLACLHPDLTKLTNYNAKLNGQLTSAHRWQFLWNFSDKTRNARGASTTRPPETTYRQYNSSNPLDAQYVFKHTWVASDKLVFENSFQYQAGGFTLDFQDPETQYDIQPIFYDDINLWGRSIDQYITDRPTTEVKTDGNYFKSDWLGGDHALKFGFRYRNTPWTTFDHYGGYAIAQFDRPNANVPYAPEYAYLYRDHNISVKLYTLSGYLQDSYSKGRFRLNLGLRWDYQDDAAGASSVVANSIIPDILPALDFAGNDQGVTFSDWSPRLSATYDLFGTGKTVLKGTYAMYYTQGGLYSDNDNPASEVVLRAEWDDANGDTFVQRSELDLSTLIVDDGNFDITTGGVPPVLNTIDPKISNDRTQEAIATISHELIPNFGLDVNYIWRRYELLDFTVRIGETQNMWVQREWVLTPTELANLPAGLPTTGWYYWEVAPGITRPENVTHRANVPSSRYNSYHGLEIVARKRYSDRWMMQGSVTWNNYQTHGQGYVIDRTNIAPVNYFDETNRDRRYVAKLNGLYSAPWQINVSANLNIQEGATREVVYRAPNRISSQRFGGFSPATGARQNLGVFDFRVEPMGSTHLPTLTMLDLQAEKTFRFGRNRLSVTGTVFNVFNVATILGYTSNRLDQSTFTRVSSIVAPRVGRVMLRWSF